MRICFISPELPPYLTGGAGVATLNFAKALVRKGVKVTVITRRLVSKKKYEVIDGVRVFRLSCTKIRKPLSLTHLLFTLKAFLLGKRLRHEIDLFYSLTLFSPGLITAFLRRSTKKITIVHGRGIDIERLYESKGLKREFGLWVLKNNTYNFMLSHDHMKKVQKVFDEDSIDKKLYLFTNGIKLDFNKTKKQCRDELDFDSDKFHITYVGRVDRPKGLIYAVQALKNVSNAVLHIIGEETGGRTEVTNELKAYIFEHDLRSRVIFHGLQNRERVYTFDKASDAFIYPLLIAAGMGNSVLEAMFLGTPVIGTNIGYFPELITNNESGLLVKPADSKAIELAIINLMKDVALRKKLIKNALSFVRKYHDWDSIADKFVEFMKNEKIYT